MNDNIAKDTQLLIILGQQLDENWRLIQDLVERLDLAGSIYNTNPDIKILVCGKYAISFDWMGIKPQAFECMEMKQYLVANGIPAYIIATENKSKDTIGNVYYAKQYVKKHPKYKII